MGLAKLADHHGAAIALLPPITGSEALPDRTVVEMILSAAQKVQ
jgi:hypothetical protein